MTKEHIIRKTAEDNGWKSMDLSDGRTVFTNLGLRYGDATRYVSVKFSTRGSVTSAYSRTDVAGRKNKFLYVMAWLTEG